MRTSSRSLVAAVAVLAAACGESTPAPTPQAVAFGSDAISLLADDSLAVPATVTMSNGAAGSPSLVSYSTSDATVATVDAKGLVKALAAGVATISARVGTLRDDLVVTVAWAPIVSITFGRDTATLLLDDSLSTSVVVMNSHDKPAPNAVVTYSSSNSGVATVDGTGRIRTFGTGAAMITATVEQLQSNIAVTVVPHFTQIAVGGAHTCGIAGTGRLYCWGSNTNGQLGVGGADCTAQIGAPCSPVPILVTTSERFVGVTAGEGHTCALRADGKAYCWGSNQYAQVGSGTASATASVGVPTLVTGGHSFKSLRAGSRHTCGLTTTGETYCWGWDYQGQLGAGVAPAGRCVFGDTAVPCSVTPLKVVGGLTFVKVAAAGGTSCGQDAGGAMYCWGLEVGGTDATDCQASQTDSPKCTRTPLLQVRGATLPTFDVGDIFRCGQKFDGTIWCWGMDYWGYFGNGVAGTPSDTLVRAAGGRTYGQTAFGASHSCAVNAGTVECWGNNDYGQAGGTVGVNRLTPGPVASGFTFASVFAGPVSSHTCGVSAAGRAYCWGYGPFGQLGNGAFVSGADPVLVKLVR